MPIATWPRLTRRRERSSPSPAGAQTRQSVRKTVPTMNPGYQRGVISTVTA